MLQIAALQTLAKLTSPSMYLYLYHHMHNCYLLFSNAFIENPVIFNNVQGLSELAKLCIDRNLEAAILQVATSSFS